MEILKKRIPHLDLSEVLPDEIAGYILTEKPSNLKHILDLVYSTK